MNYIVPTILFTALQKTLVALKPTPASLHESVHTNADLTTRVGSNCGLPSACRDEVMVSQRPGPLSWTPDRSRAEGKVNTLPHRCVDTFLIPAVLQLRRT